MHRITAGFIFTDSHSQTHIHRFTFSQARPAPPLPRLPLSPGPAKLRRIDWVCLVDYSCVTSATKTHENAIGGPFWSDTCHENAAEPCQVYPPMLHLDRNSPESVAGGLFPEDTCHGNAAELRQVYLGEPCWGGHWIKAEWAG